MTTIKQMEAKIKELTKRMKVEDNKITKLFDNLDKLAYDYEKMNMGLMDVWEDFEEEKSAASVRKTLAMLDKSVKKSDNTVGRKEKAAQKKVWRLDTPPRIKKKTVPKKTTTKKRSKR